MNQTKKKQVARQIDGTLVVAVVVVVVFVEETQTGGDDGAAARGQHPRAPANVQPERSVRQAAPQSADVRLREAAVSHRNAAAGHHVHRLHGRGHEDGEAVEECRLYKSRPPAAAAAAAVVVVSSSRRTFTRIVVKKS